MAGGLEEGPPPARGPGIAGLVTLDVRAVEQTDAVMVEAGIKREKRHPDPVAVALLLVSGLGFLGKLGGLGAEHARQQGLE